MYRVDFDGMWITYSDVDRSLKLIYLRDTQRKKEESYDYCRCTCRDGFLEEFVTRGHYGARAISVDGTIIGYYRYFPEQCYEIYNSLHIVFPGSLYHMPLSRYFFASDEESIRKYTHNLKRLIWNYERFICENLEYKKGAKTLVKDICDRYLQYYLKTSKCRYGIVNNSFVVMKVYEKNSQMHDFNVLKMALPKYYKRRGKVYLDVVLTPTMWRDGFNKCLEELLLKPQIMLGEREVFPGGTDFLRIMDIVTK